MNKYKYLLKNVGLLIMSNFGTKIFSFILIPIYTGILSTTEYGTYDVYSTTISLLIPILTINIVDSVMRYSLDEKINKDEIFSIGFKYWCRASLIFVILNIINYIFNIIPLFKQYIIYFILLFIFEILYSLLSQFCKGLEKISCLAFAGAINSITVLVLNVAFLVLFKLGLSGYFLASIFGYIIPVVYLIIKLKIWKYINIGKTNKKLNMEMTRYSRPLIFNTIGWWITNVSDRYIVTIICGVAANGIYSIAYKIPSLLNIFQSIFSQAWTLSAVKEYQNDSNEMYKHIYKIYNICLIIICSTLIIGDKLLAKVLFSKEFYFAWKYAPFLMVSVVFGSLSGLLGGIFSAIKDSKSVALSTIIGALVNILLNIIFVTLIGPIGAAIATLVAYIAVWIFRTYKINEKCNLRLYLKKDIFAYILLIVQSIILVLFSNNVLIYVLQFAIMFLIVLTYLRDIKDLASKIIVNIRRKR